MNEINKILQTAHLKRIAHLQTKYKHRQNLNEIQNMIDEAVLNRGYYKDIGDLKKSQKEQETIDDLSKLLANHQKESENYEKITSHLSNRYLQAYAQMTLEKFENPFENPQNSENPDPKRDSTLLFE